MAFKNYNVKDNAFSTLLTGITASATSMQVQAGDSAKFPPSNFIATLVQYQTSGDETSAVLKREKVLVTNNATDTFTITRGFDGDTPLSFNAGDFVYLNMVSKITEDMQTEIARLETDKLDNAGELRTGLGNHKIIYTDNTGNETELAVGGEGTVLTSTGTTSNPEFSNPSGVITGEIKIWTTSSAPTGFLICDGSAISRTTYSDLFAVISDTYGNGDGTTTFNLPNLKGRVVAGFDVSQIEFDTLGETGGAKTHTLTASEIPSHTHNMEVVYPAFLPNGDGNDKSGGGGADARGTQTSDGGNVGGQAHNNLQPYLTLNYIIKI